MIVVENIRKNKVKTGIMIVNRILLLFNSKKVKHLFNNKDKQKSNKVWILQLHSDDQNSVPESKNKKSLKQNATNKKCREKENIKITCLLYWKDHRKWEISKMYIVSLFEK